MPRRNDIEKILIIGSGPIIIGQACEFDYSGHPGLQGAQGGRLRGRAGEQQPRHDHDRPGVRRPHLHRAHHPECVEKIIERERPDALLPTLGGQTGLNVAVALAEDGTLERYGVELIGATHEVINKAEDRNLFKEAMRNIGLDLPGERLRLFARGGKGDRGEDGLPAGHQAEPSLLGGGGGGLVYNMKEFWR